MTKLFVVRFLKTNRWHRLVEKRSLFLACVSLSLAGLATTCASFATDICREPWHWSDKIPAAVLPPKPPVTEREPRMFDHLRISLNTSMKDLVARLGVPDGFAPQFFVTQTEGVPVGSVNAGPEAGTFRYVLRDKGEVFISVSDFHTIKAAWRFQKSGVRHELYRRDAF
jgi:hypothetical protein